MSKLAGVIVALAIIVGSYFLVAQILNRFSGTSTVNRDSYISISVKACMREAERDNLFTTAEARAYCECTVNGMFAGMTSEQIKRADSEFLRTNAFTDEQEDIIVECAERHLL